MLVLNAVPAIAQPVSSDPQMAQPMVTEIRELRQDLRNVAATIQRSQIIMYRLQTQSALVDKASQRLDQARSECKQAQMQQKLIASQIERAEAKKRNSQTGAAEQSAELLIANLQSSLDMFMSQAQQCQPEEIDADNQFRAEQAKMNELQNQLDYLDQVLAGQARK
jgi:hypothetical protein